MSELSKRTYGEIANILQLYFAPRPEDVEDADGNPLPSVPEPRTKENLCDYARQESVSQGAIIFELAAMDNGGEVPADLVVETYSVLNVISREIANAHGQLVSDLPVEEGFPSTEQALSALQALAVQGPTTLETVVADAEVVSESLYYAVVESGWEDERVPVATNNLITGVFSVWRDGAAQYAGCVTGGGGDGGSSGQTSGGGSGGSSNTSDTNWAAIGLGVAGVGLLAYLALRKDDEPSSQVQYREFVSVQKETT